MDPTPEGGLAAPSPGDVEAAKESGLAASSWRAVPRQPLPSSLAVGDADADRCAAAIAARTDRDSAENRQGVLPPPPPPGVTSPSPPPPLPAPPDAPADAVEDEDASRIQRNWRGVPVPLVEGGMIGVDVTCGAGAGAGAGLSLIHI